MILDDIFSYSDRSGFMRFLSYFYSNRTKVMITVGIIILLILAVVHGSLWVLFEKSGKKGFASIIPFYTVVELVKMTGLPGYYFLLAIIPVVHFYGWYVIDKELARVFMQKPTYGTLMFIAPPIFLLKLALGEPSYDINYYYKSVNDSSISQYDIVNRELNDYNQGLIFDPKTNVDDVVKSAPYDPTLSNFFREKDESENEYMAFLDMSDDAKKNEEMNMGAFNAVPNNFNEAPVNNNIMNEVPTSANNMSTEPNKMSVEALMGRPTTEDINMPKPEMPQAQPMDMNNIFNVGMTEQPRIEENVPNVEMNNMGNMAPPIMEPTPVAPTPVTSSSIAPGPVMTNPLQEPINPQVEEEQGLSPEAQENINDDISKILGLDVNNMESVPVPSVQPEIPTIGGDIVPPTNPVEVFQATDLANGGNNLVQNATEFASKETPQDVGAPVICPTCGTTLPNGAKFCYMCGKAI